MASRPWTSKELAYLRTHSAQGAAALSVALNRTRKSVVQEAVRADISLRQPGSRRGRVIGQLRGKHLSPEVREALLHARTLTDPGVVHEVCPTCGRSLAPALCPSCGRRPIACERTGLCKTCHRDRLLEAYAERVAEQRLVAARQEACRERHKDSELRGDWPEG
jgi:hypothetical protein